MIPITVYGLQGPNPPKVAMILAELGLPYEAIATPISDVKQDWYTALNPNGRLPTLVDPNTNITVWESGAIIEYLIETYDKDHKISFKPGTAEYFHAKQWLFFQSSGQGPYYGQAFWFKKYHPEKLPSAVERYAKEANRVTAVLENWLKDRTWLVGEKLSYADLSFFVYQTLAHAMMFDKDEYNQDEYPNVKKWLQAMKDRQSVQEVLKDAGMEFLGN